MGKKEIRLRILKWLRTRVQSEKPPVLSVVIILYLIMIYEFYSGKLVNMLLYYFMALIKSPMSPRHLAYIALFVLAILCFIWSSIIVVLCAIELADRLKGRRSAKK
jgi:preprotein translocase subunit SecY